jgi:hypothetical protein
MQARYLIPLGSSNESIEIRPRILRSLVFYKGERKVGSRITEGWMGFRVKAPDGQEFEVRYKPRIYDVLPIIQIDGDRVEYEPPGGLAYAIAFLMLAPVAASVVVLWVVILAFYGPVFEQTFSDDPRMALFFGLVPLVSWFLLAGLASRMVRAIQLRPQQRMVYLLILIASIAVQLIATIAYTVAVIAFVTT